MSGKYGAGFKPEYLLKLTEDQREFLSCATGVKFAKEFLFKHGNHLFIIGNTGSGKTQKGYWCVDWLKHTENIIWISTGKSDEILPLLCMGKKVRIIIPKGSDFHIEEHKDRSQWENVKNLEIVQVGSSRESWWAVHSPEYDKNNNKLFNWINIFEFRNTISDKKGQRSQWMAELFESLAEWTREGTMPTIFPCSIFVDESQWVLAGTRITTDHNRVKTSEIVTENALEMRSAGGRLIFFAQDYKNITPASRENMICNILCRGTQIDRAENAGLSTHCNMKHGRSPSRYTPEMGKFIHADNSAYPMFNPWEFPLFPKDEKNRNWIKKVRVRYGRKFGDQTKEEELKEECFPELGRFSALAIKPEVQEMAESRWDIPGGLDDI